MIGTTLGQQGFELLEDGLDEVRWECGHGFSPSSGSLEDSPDDRASRVRFPSSGPSHLSAQALSCAALFSCVWRHVSGGSRPCAGAETGETGNRSFVSPLTVLCGRTEPSAQNCFGQQVSGCATSPSKCRRIHARRTSYAKFASRSSHLAYHLSVLNRDKWPPDLCSVYLQVGTIVNMRWRSGVARKANPS